MAIAISEQNSNSSMFNYLKTYVLVLNSTTIPFDFICMYKCLTYLCVTIVCLLLNENFYIIIRTGRIIKPRIIWFYTAKSKHIKYAKRVNVK